MQKLRFLLLRVSFLFLGYSSLFFQFVHPSVIMESSKVPGDSDECSSSESGWTMYLASPVHEDSNCENDDDDDNDHAIDKKGDDDSNDGDGDDDDKSDDSMASDASSGPSYSKLPYKKAARNHVLGQSKHSERDQDQSKFSTGNKPYKQVENETFEKGIKAEKEVLGHNADSAAGYAQSGAKVRKNSKKEKK